MCSSSRLSITFAIPNWKVIMTRARRTTAGIGASALLLTPLIGIVGATSTALAGPAPAASVSRAEAAPSGKGLIRIDGGDATVTPLGKKTYRVTLPVQAGVQWVGEVQGKGLQSGRFSPRGLVKGWTKLGHRPGVGSLTTITWSVPGQDLPETELVYVSDPRVNSAGKLVFRVRSTGQSLPATLPDFSFNVARADKAPRGYPIYFSVLTVSATSGLQASAGSDYSASTAFVSKDSSGNWQNCSTTGANGQPANPAPANSNVPPLTPFGPYTCGDVTYVTPYSSSTPTQLVWSPRVGSKGASEIDVYFSISTSTGTTPFAWTLGRWKSGGGSPCPVNNAQSC